jgi:hypothetical protein
MFFSSLLQQHTPATHSKTLRVFLFSFLKGPTFSTMLTCCKYRTLLASSLILSPSYYVTACDDESYEARIGQNAGLRDAHVAVCSADVLGVFITR